MSEVAGVLESLWRFPVKSMQGESITSSMVTANGLLGDRAYALIDAETGKVASAKSVKHFPNLLACRAWFNDEPSLGQPLPAATLHLADGSEVQSDDPEVNSILSGFFGREVRLATSAPLDFTVDQYHPDVAGGDPRDVQDTVVEQKLGAAFFAEYGLPSPVAEGAFMDLYPVTVLTSSSLRHLSALAPESQFDPRRFRMNFNLATDQPGLLENDWMGQPLCLGELELELAIPALRCVMTTLAQNELPHDTGVLRALVAHNRQSILGDDRGYPCAGAYGTVTSSGTVRVGDQLSVRS